MVVGRVYTHLRPVLGLIVRGQSRPVGRAVRMAHRVAASFQQLTADTGDEQVIKYREDAMY
jgi:hypothetical protein